MSEQQPNAENEFESMLHEVLARKDEEIARLEALLTQASEQLGEPPAALEDKPVGALAPAHAPEPAPSESQIAEPPYDPLLATRSLSEPVQIVLDARKPG